MYDLSKRLFSISREIQRLAKDVDGYNTIRRKLEYALQDECFAKFIRSLNMQSRFIETAKETTPIKHENNNSAKEDKMLLQIEIPGVYIDNKPRKDGRWQGRIIKDGILQKTVYAESREKVLERIQAFLSGKSISKIRPRKNYTPILSEWLDKWFSAYKKPNVKASTERAISATLDILKKNFGHVEIGKLNPMDIQQYAVSYKSTRSRDLQMTYLNQAMAKAVKLKIIKSNPCEDLEYKKHKYGHKGALTRTQQAAFIAAISEHVLRPLFMLLLTTGLRIGEALALTYGDIDRERSEVTVNKNCVFIKGERILQTPKSKAAYRTVPMPAIVLELLPLGDSAEVVFDITYNSTKLVIDRIRKRLCIEDLSVHTLRHTYATRLDEASIAPKVKQYWLGHSRIEITQNIYTDVQKEHIDNQRKAFDDIFNDFDT